MAKIKLKANAEQVEQAESFGDFEDLRPGVYRMKVKELNVGFSKNDDGSEDKKRKRVEVILTLVSMDREGKVKPDKTYGQVWDYISLTSEGAAGKRASWALALGGTKKADGSVDFDLETDPAKPGTDIGKNVIVRIKGDEKPDGSYQAKVGSVWPLKPDDSGAVDDDEVAADEEEAEEEDADNPFGDDEAAEDEDSLLTMEDLLDEGQYPTLKELGALAGEFDLDPKDSLVKVKGKVSAAKTRIKLAEAILEAQGADADDEGEEDPF